MAYDFRRSCFVDSKNDRHSVQEKMNRGKLLTLVFKLNQAEFQIVLQKKSTDLLNLVRYLFMKYLLFFFCIVSFCKLTAQPLGEGVFKSNKLSYQADFYIEIKNNMAYLYGWDHKPGTDTMYFRAESKWVKGADMIRFNNYRYSTTPVTPYVPGILKAEPGGSFYSLHNTFGNFRREQGGITAIATKDGYDSRADLFVFERM